MKTQNTQLKPEGPRIASTSAGLLIRSNSYRAAVIALFFCGTTLLSTSAASADTITVINTNDSGPGSLRQALVKANDGDTINFDSSLNGQRITLTSGQLNVDKDVTISGPGAKNLAVDGTTQSRVFYVNPGKTVTIDGLTVANGHTFFGGGGIYNDAGALTVTNSTLSGNSTYSGGGGGIYNDAGALTVTNCMLSGNSVDSYGGGIYNDAGALTVTNSTLSGNYAYSGGGINNEDAALTLSNCTISGNLSGYGGAVTNAAFAGSATMTVTNCTLSGNGAGKGGGGIANFGQVHGATAMLTITNSTISGNSQGGGIYNSADDGSVELTITNSTVSGNEDGGIGNEAFYPSDRATLAIINSTISGNSAGSGGGIRNDAYDGVAMLMIANSTISGNSADYEGGGIFNYAYAGLAAVETGDTIFDAGSSGENIFNYAGTVTSLGYNVSSDDGGGYLTGPGDQINTDPVLGPLQDNGGPTFTHSLLPHSPAIDTGDPNFTPPPFYDQRGPGFDRVVNGRIDVGSFEVQGPRPTPTPRPSATPRHRPTPVPRP